VSVGVQGHLHVGAVCTLSAWPSVWAVMSICWHRMGTTANLNLTALHIGT
jgi:hypothetical protein